MFATSHYLSRILCLWIIALVQNQPATAPASDDVQNLSLNSKRVTFDERHPDSSIEAQHRRHKINMDEVQKYDLASESYELVVPENTDDDDDDERPYGLIVWISPGPHGNAPQRWLETLRKHRLIWIGANDAGNDRGIAVRFGLALDAVHNLTKQYDIDENRIYVAGFSGGGKASSMAAVIYPDVFNGAISLGGTAYFRNVPAPTQKNGFYGKLYDKPPKKMFELARDHARICLLIGTEDFNFVPVGAKYRDGFMKDDFKHVTYIEVPGLSHELCDEARFEKALLAVDAEPLREPRPEVLSSKTPARRGVAPQTRPADSDRRQPPNNDPEAEAARLLNLAQNYVRNHMKPQAKQRLEQIIEKFPNTKAAIEARRLLDSLNADEHR